MQLIGLGIFFVSWAAFGLPSPYWLQPSIVWLAGIICFAVGWIDVRVGARRR